jgi:plasmid replication initiation protein
VIAYPGDRLPGTFDQDVYVEVMRRYHDAGSPADGVVGFTLHSFLRSLGRRVDGRTYEQLRSSLSRLQHTVLESSAAYFDASTEEYVDSSFTLLSSVTIHRRRTVDLHQTSLFPVVASSEPGVARLVLAPALRRNIRAGRVVTVEIATYLSLQSAVARRLYRLLEVARIDRSEPVWHVTVSELARMLPLAQRYPSHLMRVLHPAHGMLIAAGVLAGATVVQRGARWGVEYGLATSAPRPAAPAEGKDLA